MENVEIVRFFNNRKFVVRLMIGCVSNETKKGCEWSLEKLAVVPSGSGAGN